MKVVQRDTSRYALPCCAVVTQNCAVPMHAFVIFSCGRDTWSPDGQLFK